MVYHDAQAKYEVAASKRITLPDGEGDEMIRMAITTASWLLTVKSLALTGPLPTQFHSPARMKKKKKRSANSPSALH